MNPFKHYRESVQIRDNLKCRHITAGIGSYYAGYYHGKKFEDCVMYLDEIDNKNNEEDNTNSESIDYKFIQENAEIDLQISAEFS